MLERRSRLRDLDFDRPRGLSAGFSGGGRSNLDFGFCSSEVNADGASGIGVSSVLVTVASDVAVAGGVASLISIFIGDLLVGDWGLLSSFASLAARGSRGTRDFGGCALRIGGSRDSERSSAGLCRDFFISSLS